MSQVYLQVPPLRVRDGDITKLAEHFLEDYNKTYGTALKGLKPGAVKKLKELRFGNNTSELKQLIHKYAADCSKEYIGAEDIFSSARETTESTL